MSRKILLLSLVLTFFCSCSSSGTKLEPGLCLVNDDCPQSQRCYDGVCRDIYHPNL